MLTYKTVYAQAYVWDTNTLSWIPWTGAVTGGGGGGGGAVTVANGSDVNAGATTDAAVDTDANGTLSGKLRGIVKLLASVISAGKVLVDGSGATQPVSGTFFQATQPVSAAALPLPAGAATSALQTQPGVDIGDVTVNNAAGVSAVNVQDGGNSLTVDGSVTANAGTNLNTSLLALEGGGNLATIAAKDFATQTTLALIKAKTDNIDVAISTRTKPADQQHVIVDSSAAIAVTGPLTDAELRAVPVPISGSVTATSAATATELAPDYTEAAASDLSQTLEGQLRALSHGVVTDLPTPLLENAIHPISLTPEGRLRVSAVSSDIFQVWQHTFDSPWESEDLPHYIDAIDYPFLGKIGVYQ